MLTSLNVCDSTAVYIRAPFEICLGSLPFGDIRISDIRQKSISESKSFTRYFRDVRVKLKVRL